MTSIEKQIDIIYSQIDSLLRAGEFSKVDDILAEVDVENKPVSILIGYLTISCPFMWDWHIKNTGHISKAREDLFNRIHDKLKKDEVEPNRIRRLLSGLGYEFYK